jgi:hypothetical protein
VTMATRKPAGFHQSGDGRGSPGEREVSREAGAGTDEAETRSPRREHRGRRPRASP